MKAMTPNQILAIPQLPSPEQALARNLARRYIEETERFDRGVCTGRICRDGGRMPANEWERITARRAALDIERRLLEDSGISFRVFRDARSWLWSNGEGKRICQRVNQE